MPEGAPGGFDVRKYISDNFSANMEASEAFMVICFWRPILNDTFDAEAKLINNPLAVLDCSSVKNESIVKQYLHAWTLTGQPMPNLVLKHDEEQRWCYYPDMTCDEVLAFK